LRKGPSGRDAGSGQEGPDNTTMPAKPGAAAPTIDVVMDDTRYLLPGGEIEYTATVIANTQVRGLSSRLEAESGFSHDQAQPIDLEKDTPARITWRLSAREDVSPGAYPLKVTVSDASGILEAAKTSRVVVEKPVTVPILNVKAPTYSVVQDKAFSTIWKVTAVAVRYTYLMISVLVLIAGFAYLLKRRKMGRLSRLAMAGHRQTQT